MIEKEPSRTAWMAATHRAAHQVLESGRIFADPLALPILGLDAETVARDALAHPARRAMRAFVAARSAFAETALARAVEGRGLDQLVVLGAGLDTFAYRNPFADRLRVFEVDHPATQAWKRRRLGEAGVAAPGDLVYAAVDFERDTLLDGLRNAGFDDRRPAFFVWLGVAPYLTPQAVRATLAVIGGLPGSAVVFDYADPPSALSDEARAAHVLRAERVAALGEPWLSYFEPAVLHALLRNLGFVAIEDLGPPDLARRYWPVVARQAPERGGHVLLAAT
ncbi:class I SAM-dependent methyltransferase [Caulobacter sp. BE254]|uniref:class I SAM-dependent methyltransferase n=1 Tax=Caulobacter sp. BE254 TaxID=2817720 RepID=UPI002855098C|nr:class I SAM-dependent methyltransferase [Caulobacter sp. BE254]MDR7119008.1 methyltransferase (TIGR00027 family) [Caulobacter sp. BE254]